jgi:hypothetical protein
MAFKDKGRWRVVLNDMLPSCEELSMNALREVVVGRGGKKLSAAGVRAYAKRKGIARKIGGRWFFDRKRL